MDFFSRSGEPAGRHFIQEDPARFHPSRKHGPVRNTSNITNWAEPRTPEFPDYPHFGLAQTSKDYPGSSLDFFEVPPTFYPTQYPPQNLSPASSDQASTCIPVHSPQIVSELYDPMADGNSFAMPSLTSEYDVVDQDPYRDGDSVGFQGRSFVNMYDVNNGSGIEHSSMNMDGYNSSLALGRESITARFRPQLGSEFQRTLSPNPAASETTDAVMTGYPTVAGPYWVERTEIDPGAPAMTPPEEEDDDYTAQSRCNNSRTSIRRKRAPSSNKPTPKPAPKKSKTTRGPAGKPKVASCKTCTESFSDSASLQEHVQRAHARSLVCVFEYAGCTATFSQKNEWKRHVLSQHVILSYWLCTDAACVRANPKSKGTVFNRKDLYTQHVRRMHVPDLYRDAVTNRTPEPDWDRMLRSMQDDAERKRCKLPTYMQCPAVGCSAEFRGTNAWDDRMEHVAKHLDRAGSLNEPRVFFGGDNDKTLTEWATLPEVDIVRRVGSGDRWQLDVPLMTTAKEVGSARKVTVFSPRGGGGDEDGDGEPE